MDSLPDMKDITRMVKVAALDAVESASPVKVLFGKVISIAPLKIMVDQKLILNADQLVLTHAVVDYNLDETVDHFTVNDNYLDTIHSHTKNPPEAGEDDFDSTHKHAYKGRKTFLIHNGLVVGDEVILLQVQGGQKFVVIERVVEPL